MNYLILLGHKQISREDEVFLTLSSFRLSKLGLHQRDVRNYLMAKIQNYLMYMKTTASLIRSDLFQ